MAEHDWDAHASGWDESDAVRAYADAAFASLGHALPASAQEPGFGRVLDFGCGTGLLSEKLAPRCREVVAVDTSVKMIDVLRRKLESGTLDRVVALTVSGDVTTFDGYTELATPFDLVVASSVCSFLPDYEHTLRTIARRLRPSGHFVQWDWLGDMPLRRISNAFAGAGLSEILVDEAFTVEAGSDTMRVAMGVGQRGAR